MLTEATGFRKCSLKNIFSRNPLLKVRRVSSFILDTLDIETIAFGLGNGQTTQSGQFGLHDLTIGSAVPEPGSLAIFGVALSGLAIFWRRRMAT
jgi:hypothetical protein